MRVDNLALFQAATALSQNGHGLLRIGGSLQDSVTYDFESKQEHCGDFLENPSNLEGYGKGCITKLKRKQLMEFAKKTNMKIIFGLNGKVGKTEIGHNFTGQSSKQHSASKICFQEPGIHQMHMN